MTRPEAVRRIHAYYREGCPRCGKAAPREILGDDDPDVIHLRCGKCGRRERIELEDEP